MDYEEYKSDNAFNSTAEAEMMAEAEAEAKSTVNLAGMMRNQTTMWIVLLLSVGAFYWWQTRTGGTGLGAGLNIGELLPEQMLTRQNMLMLGVGALVLYLWYQQNRGTNAEGFNGEEGEAETETVEEVGAENGNGLNWNHKNAAAYYSTMVKRFGSPAYVVRQPGGVAVWNKEQLGDTSIFVRHELHDESIPHCRPFKHRDFLYSFVNYSVQPTLSDSVLSLSGSLSYDPLKKWLRARCGSIEANIATLTLATKIGEAQISLEYVQDNDVYAQWILGTKDPSNVEKMYEELVFNIAHQKGNPKMVGYSVKSFPRGCAKADTNLADQYADSLMHITSHEPRKV